HEYDAVLEHSRVDVVHTLTPAVVSDHGWNHLQVGYLRGWKPMGGRAFGGGLAIAMYALKSATLRRASMFRPAVASRSLTGGSSGHTGRSESAPRRRARSAWRV